MTIQIQINKTGLVLETGDFPQVSQDFIFGYGLRQILNDCHSSIKRADYDDEASFVEAVNSTVKAKLTALESGEITTRRAAGEPVDPVEKIAYRMAKAAVQAALKSKGVKAKDISADKLAELTAAHLDKSGEAIRKLAKAEHKRAMDAANAVDIDLSELGL